MNELQKGEILIYQSESGDTKIDVYLEDGTVWLSQALIADLYQTTPQNIIMHTRNIYKDGELDETATCKQSLQVQIEGTRSVRRTVKYYNLDMILAIGYRVRSHIGLQNMGLTTYEGASVRQSDVTIAKNYLSRDELEDLNRIVTMFLDHAEDMARQKIPMYMKDWVESLNEFLKFRRRNILHGKGKISNEDMERRVLLEYAKFNTRRLKSPERADSDDDIFGDLNDVAKSKK